MTFLPSMSEEELWEGELESVTVAGRPVLLARVDGHVVAYLDRCPHLGIPLSEGRLTGTVLECPAHQWCFDMRTGEGVNPRNVRLRRFTTRVEAGVILVDATPEEEPR